MKIEFDCTITNPPYGAGMHVDFINLGINFSRFIVAMHPTNPIFNRKPVNRTKRDKKLLEYIGKYKTDLYLFDGNNVFNGGFFVPLSITTIDKSKPSDVISISGVFNDLCKLNELNHLGSWANKYYDKINLVNNLYNNRYICNGKNELAGFYVSISAIRGHPPSIGNRFNPDFFTFVPDDITIKDKPFNKTGWSNFRFDTLVEAENFLFYLKSKPARFYLSLYKTNQHLDSKELLAVPLIDFNKKYTESELYDLLCIDEIDRKNIDMVIGDYYNGERSNYMISQDTRTFTSNQDRKRQQENKEFFTPVDYVDMMIDRCDINWSFFEPACGDGNILIRLLERKLESGISKLDAIKSLYGCEYMLDNRNACIKRLVNVVGEEFIDIIEKQIAYCNTLDYNDISDGRKYPDWLRK